MYSHNLFVYNPSFLFKKVAVQKLISNYKSIVNNKNYFKERNNMLTRQDLIAELKEITDRINSLRGYL